MQQLENDFSQVVPGAGDKSDQFLSVIKHQCDQAGIGLDLHPAKPNRKQDRIVLRGNVPIEAAFLRGKGRPVMIEVYADRVGTSSALTVGWQLMSDHHDANFLQNTNAGARMTYKLDKQDSNPDKIRQVNAAVQAFHSIVFLPVLQQLADACRPQQAAGFFTAS